MRTTRAVAGSGTGRTGVLLLLVCLWVGWLPYCLVRGFALPQGPGRLSRCSRWPLRPLPLPSRPFQPLSFVGASLVAGSDKVEGTSGEDGRAVGGDTVRGAAGGQRQGLGEGIRSLELMLLLDRIDVKLEKTNDLVKAEVGAAEARMGTRVDDAVRSLRAEVGASEARTGTRVDDAVSSLRAEVGASEARMGTRVDDAVGAAEARMEMKMESLGTKIGVAEERMGMRMDALDTRMGTRMDALDTRMEAGEAQFKGMMVKQDEFTKTIVKVQAVGTALVLIGGTLGTLVTNGAQLKAFWDSL
ncbi:hypothetical protein Naga_102050g1 [Nannochloropsis gaditana]|uniref:Uncharacterized protein n=1 Tax=Nannochloropsis gaditana TaxID=72520 RepID=W7SYX1_9STRA|nr:hypothetical protein Naga_102050g1 [Nannochloropsis gaditana]